MSDVGSCRNAYWRILASKPFRKLIFVSSNVSLRRTHYNTTERFLIGAPHHLYKLSLYGAMRNPGFGIFRDAELSQGMLERAVEMTPAPVTGKVRNR